MSWRTTCATAAIATGAFDLVVLDVRMPGGDGIDLIPHARARAEAPTVVVLTGHSSIEDAVRAMRAGALDYLTKPVTFEALDRLVGRVAEIRAIRRDAPESRDGLTHPAAFADIVGEHPRLLAVLAEADKVAPTSATVLIEGESGTGKELFARAVHVASSRADGPFIVLGASNLNEHLIESELFGHERGAFTGAVGARRGLVTLADGGTLFIDEIGEMPLSCQARFLRVLEAREYRAVGSTTTRTADFRVVAATNRYLAVEVKQGRFREDLFFRLAVFRLTLPPLRDRAADIPALARTFARQQGRADDLTEEAQRVLTAHPWPGNVRELAHVVQRACILVPDGPIPPGAIRFPGGPGATLAPDGDLLLPLEQVEAEHIGHVLNALGWNKRRSARVLGISVRNLYRKIARYRLSPA